MPTLVSFSGLPGTGKSTIARQLSARTGAVYLRIDEIEVAILALNPGQEAGPESYQIAAALAASNLELGHTTIIDCVNPWDVTRELFTSAATRAGTHLLRVEILCSDTREHRRRVESREADIPGLIQPDWQKVLNRSYSPWLEAELRIDTASTSADHAVAAIAARLGDW
ncbi:AAA family ATPase [Radicibacter daui]|uniref:AAA family ATPase n=1 Tax=Radicibacter daui TaxID=3064829 RepID=UPI004046CD1A